MRMRLGSMGSFDRVSITQHVNTRICHFNPSSSSLPAKNHVSVLLCQQACLCGVNYHCMLKIIPMLWYDTLHVFQHQFV